MINKPGSYKITHEEYHADPCVEPSLSRSIISDLLFKSPAHAWFNHPRLNPSYKEDDGNGKFDVGEAAHAMLLEGIDNVAVIEATDWRKKESKEQRDKARADGKTPLLRHQYEAGLEMIQVAIKAIQECKELGINSLSEGDAELSYFWKEGDIWLKVRPDWIGNDREIVLDYKTTAGSANPGKLDRHMIDMKYPLQAALYCRGIKAIEGTEPKFCFLFQEVEKPYFCSFDSLTPALMEMGKQQAEYGIFMWNECLRLNKWPSYPNRICYIDAPPWALASWEAIATEIGGIE